MRVTVNLASRPFADLGPVLRNLRIGMGVLAFVALLLGLGIHLFGSKAAAARAREAGIDASLSNVTREQQTYRAMMAQPPNARVLTQSEELNRLIDEKSFSWTLAMEDLETVLPGGVQVTTLEPARDKKTGTISVRLRVVGPRDKAVALVHNLEHSRRFLLPRIVAETSESNGNGTQQALEPVSATNRFNFDVLADYNPATSSERRGKAGRTEGSADASADASPISAAPHARAPYTGMSHPPGRHQRKNTGGAR